jgi:hypothetical protein
MKLHVAKILVAAAFWGGFSASAQVSKDVSKTASLVDITQTLLGDDLWSG